ncbi:MAG: glycosyltransferase family protein [Candidatus Zixiibacteriota bacterium]|nr:MAG: glycosyltransferase family protein [candidate division Zixibacteria bacterium]
MKVVTIVQARMSSTRLPGKVMMKLAGMPMLQFQLERVRRAGQIGELVVATTTNPADEPIVQLCHRLEVATFRGEEEDVLDRYCNTASEHNADVVVRITSDCPLIDPVEIDRVIAFYRREYEKYDYVSNILRRTFPRGMECEVFSFEALMTAAREASDSSDREHVTMYIRKRPERFRLGSVTGETDHSRHRWTVDTPEDLELVQRMADEIYPRKPEFGLTDCLELLDRHPDWLLLNDHVRQKTV